MLLYTWFYVFEGLGRGCNVVQEVLCVYEDWVGGVAQCTVSVHSVLRLTEQKTKNKGWLDACPPWASVGNASFFVSAVPPKQGLKVSRFYALLLSN